MISTKTDNSAEGNGHRIGDSDPTSQEIDALVALLTEGRNTEAATLAQSMTVHFPTHWFGWKVLGALLKQMGRDADAVTPMQKAAALNPSDFEAQNNLGITLHGLSRLDEAESSYRQALQVSPDYVKAHYNLGVTLQALGRLDEAEASYRRALQINPNYAEAHYNLGVIFQGLGRLDEAEASYRRALYLNPNYWEMHYNLGVTLQKQRRFDDAEVSYRRALQINPNHAPAHSNLGSILKQSGRPEEAIVHFEQALSLDPTLDEARIGLPQALYALSLIDPEKAKHLASRARQKFVGDPIILRGIAGILGDTNVSKDDALYSQKLFDAFAPTFESTLEKIRYTIPQALADELGVGIAIVSRNLDILDAGCGTGLCGIHLKPVARNLVGVDLSAEMLRLAREKNIYDALYEDNIIDFCKKNRGAFDLIVLADVLIYVGDIQELLGSISFALRQNGTVALSAECMTDNRSSESFSLHPSGRYQHSIEYLKRIFQDVGFTVKKIVPCTLREEYGGSAEGWIVIAKL